VFNRGSFFSKKKLLAWLCGTTLARRKLAAVETAIERVLIAPSGSLPIIEPRTFAAWFED